jgi:hypothetical protein
MSYSLMHYAFACLHITTHQSRQPQCANLCAALLMVSDLLKSAKRFTKYVVHPLNDTGAYDRWLTAVVVVVVVVVAAAAACDSFR